MKKRICSIYRCAKKEGMYVYVDKEQGFDHIPESLLKQMGKTELAMTLVIAADKKLARANAKDVLELIDQKGFYLQMPPSIHDTAHDSAMINLHENNHLLDRK